MDPECQIKFDPKKHYDLICFKSPRVQVLFLAMDSFVFASKR